VWKRREDEYDVFEGFGKYGGIWTNPLPWNGIPDEPAAPPTAPVPAESDADSAADRDLIAGLRPQKASPLRLARRGRIAVATLGVAAVAGLLAIGLDRPVSRIASDRPPSGEPAAAEAARAPTPLSVPPAGSVPPPIPPPAPPAPAQAPVIPRGAHGKVVVLDQSNVPALARRMARRLEAAGWEVTGTDDFRGKVPATTVYHPADQAAQARALAAALPGIGRIRPAFPGIPLNRLTVIVVDDQPVPLVDRLLGSLTTH
jgi:LytR cell envelope-related transcriptional attenuator